MTSQLIALATTFAFGFSTLTYREQAQARNWPVGMLFHEKDGTVKILSAAALFGVVFIAFVRGPWWFALVVPIAGVALGFLLLQVFRSWMQLFGFLGLAAGVLTSLFFVR